MLSIFEDILCLFVTQELCKSFYIVVNPLGSHVKKNKLSMFYFTLGTIPPIFRSRLAAIQPIAVARTNDLRKFGLQILLRDFIPAIDTRSQGGITLQINGQEYHVKGPVVAIYAETQGRPVAGFRAVRCTSV